MAVDEEKLAEELRQEGFRHTHVWQDGSNAFYAEQVHNQETAHIILSGELTLIMNDEARITLLESVATFRGELHTPREWERADVAT